MAACSLALRECQERFSGQTHGPCPMRPKEGCRGSARVCPEDAGRWCGEIFLNSIDRDGTYGGYDLELVERVSAELDIPLVVCGGAGKLADLREAVERGASAVAAGSLFVYHGKHRAVLITYPNRSQLETLFSET